MRRLVAVALMLSGCVDAGTFVCSTDDQCGDDAICGPAGCAQRDTGCASGYRYGASSEAAGECFDNCIRALAAGGGHTCVANRDGDMFCFGANGSFQLGLATDARAVNAPTLVVDASGVETIAAGDFETCVVEAEGLTCWGEDVTIPVLQQRPLSVSYGAGFGCALMAEGEVRCWGTNEFGQLGDGSRSDDEDDERQEALPVVNLPPVVRLDSGASHSCAMTDAGDVYCWGDNAAGQSGGANEENLTPRPVDSLPAALDVSTGGGHSCAIVSGGRVFCWGDSLFGQLGQEVFGESVVPVAAQGLSDVRVLSAGLTFNCAIRGEGEVWCWGGNESGQLGDGNRATARAQPMRVAGIDNAVTVAAGTSHACAGLDDGRLACWGDARSGRLGNGAEFRTGEPVLSMLGDVAELAISEAHGCARLLSGEVSCFGDDSYGQLGRGSGMRGIEPQTLRAFEATAIAVGAEHSCAVTPDGGVSCWGVNWAGQVDPGPEPDYIYDVPNAVNVGSQIVDVAAGALHTCALSSTGEVLCWGANGDGQRGGVALTPVPQVAGATTLSSGFDHNCASDGTNIWCWGWNGSGVLGIDDDEAVGPEIVGLTLEPTQEVTQLVSGAAHVCALISDGAVYCWGGDDETGVRGVGTQNTGRFGRVEVDARQLATGTAHVCALSSDNRVYCWGVNTSGQLGGLDLTAAFSPREVPGLADVSAVFAGGESTCAVTPEGVKCWGLNDYGQLANGEPVPSLEPVFVDVPGCR